MDNMESCSLEPREIEEEQEQEKEKRE